MSIYFKRDELIAFETRLTKGYDRTTERRFAQVEADIARLTAEHELSGAHAKRHDADRAERENGGRAELEFGLVSE